MEGVVICQLLPSHVARGMRVYDWLNLCEMFISMAKNSTAYERQFHRIEEETFPKERAVCDKHFLLNRISPNYSLVI